MYLQVKGGYRRRVGCCTYRSKADIDGGSASVLTGRRQIRMEGWLLYLQVKGRYRQRVS